MTGGTVLIVQNQKVLLGKVRFEGNDIDTFFTQSVAIKNIQMKDLWKEYLKWRRKSFSQICLDSEIDGTVFDGGYEYTLLITQNPTTPDEVLQLLEIVDTELNTLYPDDSYGCGYEDYILMVDLDNGTIIQCY